MNWLRRLIGMHVHDWDQWDMVNAEFVRYSGLMQVRRCKTCGKREFTL
jgi:hypothetical protein